MMMSELRRMRELAAAGVNMHQTARVLGRSDFCIAYQAKKWGIAFQKHGRVRPFSADQMAELSREADARAQRLMRQIR